MKTNQRNEVFLENSDLSGNSMSAWFVVPGDWRKPECNRSFTVYRCAQDGFARIGPIPEANVLSDHYNISDYYTRKGSDSKIRSKPTLIFKLLYKLATFFDRSTESSLEYAKKMPLDSKILDLGAGRGDTLLKLKEAGFEPVGIEPDPEANSLAENFPTLVYQGTGEDIPAAVKDQRFDLVICSHVMEHTTDPIKVMRNVHSLLKPGGKFIAEVPNTSCLDFHLCKLNWQHLGVPRHVIFWNHRSLTGAAEVAGFAESEYHYRYYARQFSWGWVNFGRPMIAYYKSKGAYKISMKQFSSFYYCLLLAMTAFLPAKWKYDSIVLVARRKD